MTHKQTLCFGQVHRFLDGLFDGDLHAKRVLSLANATLGVISTASLAVNTIGQGLALARGRMTKHAVKQVDRLLSNPGIDVDAALRHWVPHVGGVRTAAGWVGPGGRARVLRGASVTAERYKVGSVLCVQDKDMKQAWCLATSTTDASAKALMTLYGKRWSIECGLRDTKDLRFGMGMSAVHVSTPARRDRLWLLNACAIALLTLLGAAGEALGYDRHLKSNTSKTRTHSLFRQGCML